MDQDNHSAVLRRSRIYLSCVYIYMYIHMYVYIHNHTKLGENTIDLANNEIKDHLPHMVALNLWVG